MKNLNQKQDNLIQKLDQNHDNTQNLNLENQEIHNKNLNQKLDQNRDNNQNSKLDNKNISQNIKK